MSLTFRGGTARRGHHVVAHSEAASVDRDEARLSVGLPSIGVGGENWQVDAPDCRAGPGS